VVCAPAAVAEGGGEENEFCANAAAEKETIAAKQTLLKERATNNLNPQFSVQSF
jgi:hypothetical protein